MKQNAAQPVIIEDPDLTQIDAHLERATPDERVAWAAEAHGAGLIMTTSFGIQSATMLHLVTRILPEIPIVFIDTGYLFPETYRYAELLTRRLGLNLKVFNPAMTAARQEALHGRQWADGMDGLRRYNFVNKIEPMERAVRELGATAWLAGLRRVQARTREALPVVQIQNRIAKIHPIVDWSNRRVDDYLADHGLPHHPLRERGYATVGDWHSSSRLQDGMREEDTRYGGLKRECGLHEPSGRADYQI